MSVFEKYKLKPPAEFTRLVGVNCGAFQIILEKLENEITPFKQQKPMRGRGLKSSLTIADQLLLTLIYLRNYHTFRQLSEMFSISESYSQKRYPFISQRLLKALDLRGKHKNYERTWKLVSAIVSLKLSTRHLKYASP
jgi:hypothetical protein